MASSLNSLTEAALHLPAEQRLTLAHLMLVSVEPEGSPEIDAAWDAEIKARIERYRRDETKGIPAEEVFAELRQRRMAIIPPDPKPGTQPTPEGS